MQSKKTHYVFILGNKYLVIHTINQNIVIHFFYKIR